MTIIGKDARGFWRAADDIAIDAKHVVRIETFRNYARELRTTATLFARINENAPTMISTNKYSRLLIVTTPRSVTEKTCVAQHAQAMTRTVEIIAEARAALTCV